MSEDKNCNLIPEGHSNINDEEQTTNQEDGEALETHEQLELSESPPLETYEQSTSEYIEYGCMTPFHNVLRYNYNEDFLKYIIRHSMTRINNSLKRQGLDEILIRWDSIPEEKMNEWYDYLFNYDVTKWETRNPIEALNPYDTFNHPEYTTNELQNVLKIRAYELEDLIISFLTNQMPEDVKRKCPWLYLCSYNLQVVFNEKMNNYLVSKYPRQ